MGRPRLTAEVRELIATMAHDNPSWGAERIRGELLKLGIAVSRTSVQRYRRRGPARPPSQSWRTFLRKHRPSTWAVDLLTVQTVTFKTSYVLVIVSHARRALVHLAVTASPTEAWIWRQLIAATPWGRAPRFLVRDRDAVYGRDFARRARGLGIETLLTPVRAPMANAVAERLVGTLRRECLDHVVVVNERHLRAILAEFAHFYDQERPTAPAPRDAGAGGPLDHRLHPRQSGAQGTPPRLRARSLTTPRLFGSHTRPAGAEGRVTSRWPVFGSL
jgi:transposase InsO family protein